MFGSGARRKITTTAAALTIGVALPLAGAAGAQAATPTPSSGSATPNSIYCEPNVHLQNQITNSNYHFGVGPVFKSGPGGSVTASSTATATVSASFTVTAGVSGGITTPALTQQAKLDVSASVATSVSVGTTVSFTHDINPGRYGNLQYGAWGFSTNWQKVQVYSNCQNKTLAQGTAKYPTTALGWHFWES